MYKYIGDFMEFEFIEKLIKLVNYSKLTEFEISLEESSLKIKKSEVESDLINIIKDGESSTIEYKNSVKEIDVYTNNSESYIISPVVGIYYSSKKGGNKPFVKLGDKVKQGDVVCIIEILNIMYEIKSDVDGQVVEIIASNDRMVEYGERLFRIKQGI